MTKYTLKHDLLLGNPDIREDFYNIWLTKDSEVIHIAKEFNVYEDLIKKNTKVKSNNFAFVKIPDTEYISDSILIFVYFYDYPNPDDNGFVMLKVININSVKNHDSLFKCLEGMGLDLSSDYIKNQIKNNGKN